MSSAVAEERTATTGEPSVRYADRISSATRAGMDDVDVVDSVDSVDAAPAPPCPSRSCQARVVTTKPSGTGNPARMSRPRLTALPPASSVLQHSDSSCVNLGA